MEPLMAVLGIFISCKEFDDFIVGFLEKTLPLHQRIAFRAHLAACSICRRYLKQYRKTMSVAKTALVDNVALPAEVPEALVQAILAARRAPDSGDSNQSG
jgi:Putative zinc-finger